MTETVSEQKGFGAYTCNEGAYNGSEESEVAVQWGLSGFTNVAIGWRIFRRREKSLVRQFFHFKLIREVVSITSAVTDGNIAFLFFFSAFFSASSFILYKFINIQVQIF